MPKEKANTAAKKKVPPKKNLKSERRKEVELSRKEAPPPERKIIQTKTYTVTHQYWDDGMLTQTRRNDGFNAYELLGICSLATYEIIQQIKSDLPVTVIKREAIID